MLELWFLSDKEYWALLETSVNNCLDFSNVWWLCFLNILNVNLLNVNLLYNTKIEKYIAWSEKIGTLLSVFV